MRGATNGEIILTMDADISIHAPREGCDFGVDYVPRKQETFQPTHPVRGATSTRLLIFFTSAPFQPTHPVRGATKSVSGVADAIAISTHAPREGCDRP